MAKNKGVRLSTNGVQTAAGKARAQADTERVGASGRSSFRSEDFDVTGARVASTPPQTDVATQEPTPEELTDLQSQLDTAGQDVQALQQQAEAQTVGTTPLGGVQGVGGVANAGTPSRFQQGAQQAIASGVAPPVDGGTGQQGVSSFLPPAPASTALVDNTLQQDPIMTGILDAFTELMSPESQRDSLLSEYQGLVKASGIDSINEELVNTRRIIEGTEDDIRSEVTATGGFATDSQVMALSSSRNKSLIKNYNSLLETRANLETSLDRMMTFSLEDRKMASDRFTQQLNFGFRVAEFQRIAQRDAKEDYNNIVRQVGYDGLLNSLGNDPYQIGIAEQTAGLPSGSLKGLAQRGAEDRASALRKEELDFSIKEAQLANLTKPAPPAKVSTQVIDTGDGVKSLINTQTGEVIATYGASGTGAQPFTIQQEARAAQEINVVNELPSHRGLNKAVGPTKLARFTPFKIDVSSGEVVDFIASVDLLTKGLTLDELVQAKSEGATFGALQVAELQLLEQSATKINSWRRTEGVDEARVTTHFEASEKDFIAELEKINNFRKLDFVLKGGNPEEVGIQQMEDGTFWTSNNDGSFTKIR